MTTTTRTVRVRYSCGAYVTGTVDGKRASSTTSAEQAAAKLAEKLWGGHGTSVHLVEDNRHDCTAPTTWRLEHVAAEPVAAEPPPQRPVPAPVSWVQAWPLRG